MLVTNDSRQRIIDLLRHTEALREGHFELPSGKHTTLYYQLALALRHRDNWRALTVGLSRVLRVTKEVSSLLPHLTIVGPSSTGIPVAFGVREALQADEVVWVENSGDSAYRFRQYGGIKKGDRCVIVDDLMITGRTMTKLADLVRSAGGEVVAAGVLVDAHVHPVDLGGVKLSSLVAIDTKHFEAKDCPECQRGTKAVHVDF